jgi:DNA primase catalytic core
MAIANEEILALKQTIKLSDVVRSRGVELKRKGKQMFGLCPFHDEDSASLAVDDEKGLWNCLGKCGVGGDVFSFIQKADGVSFGQAFKMIKESFTTEDTENTENIKQKPKSEDQKPTSEYLEKAVDYYHKSLVKNAEAIEYLESRGVSLEAIRTFKLGFADGSLKDKLNPDGKASLESLGLLNEKGNETMFGCVVFPLIDADSKKVVSLYGRKIDAETRRHGDAVKHLYLSGKRRGILNPYLSETSEIVLTESVIDALALWSIGLKNVTCSYGVNGLTDEIVEYIAECRVRKVCLLLDADEAGRLASVKFAEKFASKGIESYSVELPFKDASEFVASGGQVEELQRLIQPRMDADKRGLKKDETENLTTDHRPLITKETDGSLIIEFENRSYKVRGLSPIGLDKLKINLRLSVGNSFHLDTLDLYQSRSRMNFSNTSAKLCKIGENLVNQDLLLLIEELEKVRLELKKSDANESHKPLSKQDEAQALAFLKDKNLCERIVEDFRKCGLVGERSTVLTAYLGAVSRKLSEPLALLIVARSGAGKSALQDAICNFVPPEELVRVTRLTGQALFYKDPYSLQRKMLVIAEDEGAKEAVYSLRTLASDQRLSIAATRTDPNTGKLATEHYEVFGPVVIVITTTSSEAFDEETRSRFVQLSMNETVEQTREILKNQRRNYTLEGVLEKAEAEQIQKLHHHAQRLLRPLSVVNPFVEYLTYPSEKLIHRREQRKYLSLINSIALLHQYQREVKTARKDELEIEYVEAELSDIALANELATEILGQAMDELAPPVRGMFEAIKEACKSSKQNQLTRREIRELTLWSDWQVRMYCQKLVEMEYLFAVQSQNGKPAVYEIARDEETETPSLRGLTSIDELKKRLNQAAQEKVAAR